MDAILLDEVKKRVAPLLTEKNTELVDLILNRERGRSVLRFLVDKSGGITLDECAQLNQEISQILDQENVIQESYILEVSSPGLDRPLKTTSDFQRCLGQLLKVVLHNPLNRQNVWIGFVDKIDDENITIRTEQNGRLQIARKNIAWARLEVQV